MVRLTLKLLNYFTNKLHAVKLSVFMNRFFLNLYFISFNRSDG